MLVYIANETSVLCLSWTKKLKREDEKSQPHIYDGLKSAEFAHRIPTQYWMLIFRHGQINPKSIQIHFEPLFLKGKSLSNFSVIEFVCSIEKTQSEVSLRIRLVQKCHYKPKKNDIISIQTRDWQKCMELAINFHQILLVYGSNKWTESMWKVFAIWVRNVISLKTPENQLLIALTYIFYGLW